MTMDSAVKAGYNIDDQYGTYFMTFTFVGWIDLLSRKELRDLMVESLSYCQDHKGLVINAYLLMSSHMHMICRANEDSDGAIKNHTRLQEIYGQGNHQMDRK